MAARTNFFFLQMAVVLSLLVTVAVASRSLKAAETGPTCDTIYGVKAGDTCFSIIEAQGSKLSATLFAGINPNLNCKKLFIGQWLCIGGTPN